MCRQVQGDTSDRLLHPSTDIEYPNAKRAELCLGAEAIMGP